MSAEKTWKDVLQGDLKNYRAFVTERDKAIGSFLEFDPDRSVEQARVVSTELSGLPFAVKDNIAVKNFHCTCGSKLLASYVSPFTATVVQRLLQSGARVVGKTNLDEFGMGSSTDNSAFKQTNNPWDLNKVAGGSSGGSAAAVASGLVPFALGTDTGGSIRQPASFCGMYGLKPTYGSVSRYGLVAYASSLETVGIVAESLQTTKTVFDQVKGIDEHDHTTVDSSLVEVTKKQVKTVGLLKVDGGLDPSVTKVYSEYKKSLESLGYKVVLVDLPILEYAVPAYYTIASAEASANLARFNGIRYGQRPIFAENPDELVRKTRDEGFGSEVKLRVILGTYVLRSGFQDEYYGRAQKVRTAIRNEFTKVFANTDVMVMPVFPVPAFTHGAKDMDAYQQKIADKFTTVANLTGLPALAIPGLVVDGLPIGMQVLAPAYHEHLCFSLAESLAKDFPLVRPSAYPAQYS